ncbi:LysM peptidoglycan-binding domain-containing protein [Oculatella sp. FACHB-28]|uniref:LysM peptidoglycan-binding domain-containing protein n=1 Tax=Oculatella sp. FACHB-28 TaxID=2692845 RepID=UPI0016831B4C|nr:LysM peptidoglycan-binding domain-containing protein [Oculatella sp. FACHB-28]MBD2060515.1 LysM peptidoglycan-binding domain-containing protein [Oculatella sp. FACHB-28]
MQSSRNVSRRIELSAADSLDNLAHRYLGNASNFREIADLNNIDIFSELPVGQVINIPSIEQVEEIVRERLAQISNTVSSELEELDLSSILTSNPAAAENYQLISWLI